MNREIAEQATEILSIINRYESDITELERIEKYVNVSNDELYTIECVALEVHLTIHKSKMLDLIHHNINTIKSSIFTFEEYLNKL